MAHQREENRHGRSLSGWLLILATLAGMIWAGIRIVPITLRADSPTLARLEWVPVRDEQTYGQPYIHIDEVATVRLNADGKRAEVGVRGDRASPNRWSVPDLYPVSDPAVVSRLRSVVQEVPAHWVPLERRDCDGEIQDEGLANLRCVRRVDFFSKLVECGQKLPRDIACLYFDSAGRDQIGWVRDPAAVERVRRLWQEDGRSR